MSGKTALPVALLVVVFLTVSPAVKALAQNTCPGCSEPAKVVHPNGFGPHSYARWQPKTGLADSGGTNDFSMLLVHLTPPTITATARAVVAIEGFDGEPVGNITDLHFYVRTTDSNGAATTECTATSPRFSIRYRVPSVPDLFLEARCGVVTEMLPGDTISNGVTTYQRRTVNPVLLAPISSAIIVSLAILFDDPVQPSSHIDNISVSDANVGCAPCTWTRPADNGGN